MTSTSTNFSVLISAIEAALDALKGAPKVGEIYQYACADKQVNAYAYLSSAGRDSSVMARVPDSLAGCLSDATAALCNVPFCGALFTEEFSVRQASAHAALSAALSDFAAKNIVDQSTAAENADRLISVIKSAALEVNGDSVYADATVAAVDSLCLHWRSQFKQVLDLGLAIDDVGELIVRLHALEARLADAKAEIESEDLLKSFLSLLGAADSVSVNGCKLTEWETKPVTGDANSEAAQFSWEAGSINYSCALTEGAIAAGRWVGTGFVCEDRDGDYVEVRLYSQQALVPSVKAT